MHWKQYKYYVNQEFCPLRVTLKFSHRCIILSYIVKSYLNLFTYLSFKELERKSRA